MRLQQGLSSLAKDIVEANTLDKYLSPNYKIRLRQHISKHIRQRILLINEPEPEMYLYIYWYFSTNIFLLFDRSDKISNSFFFNSFIRLIVSYSPYMHKICN